MAITLELPAELEAQLSAEAKACGISLPEYVQERLAGASAGDLQSRLSLVEVERLLDEAAEIIPEGTPPLSDEAMSRVRASTRAKTSGSGANSRRHQRPPSPDSSRP